MKNLTLNAVDRAEITILADNYADFFLPDTETVKRMIVLPPAAPLSEPGLSILIKTVLGSSSHTFLFDTGISGTCLLQNARGMAGSRAVAAGEVSGRLEDIEAVVLSHGHFDHCGGLTGLLAETGRTLPVYLHPDAFIRRRIRIRPEVTVDMPAMDETAVTGAGAEIRTNIDPVTLFSDSVLLSGEVDRQTGFETGLAATEAMIEGEWQPDPFNDDQGIALYVKDKGLVVIGGCSHAGIINTVRHVGQVTGITRIHAVMGGFHLSGGNEKIIDPTISEMRAMAPDYVIPMHCTGWRAINRFAAEMPDAFILNSVGTTYIF